MKSTAMVGLGRHLLVQLLAAVLAWVFFAPLLHPLAWGGLAGGLALVWALVLRLGGWAACAHALFIPLAVVFALLGLPSWAYLLAFVLTFSLCRNSVLERVPLYRSGQGAATGLAREIAQGARVLDAGSGDGRLALRLALARPDLSVTALENAWGSAWLARIRWRLAGCPDNLKLECRNFWREDWGQYDVVYVFLSPAPMKKVWEKFYQQGKVGGLLISNTFAIPGVEPERRVPLPGHLQHALLFWCRHHGTE